MEEEPPLPLMTASQNPRLRALITRRKEECCIKRDGEITLVYVEERRRVSSLAAHNGPDNVISKILSLFLPSNLTLAK